MTYLSLKTKSYILVLAISALLVGSLVAPASAREYSIWEWWTDQAKTIDDITDIHPPWDGTYSAWTDYQVWDTMISKETWTVPVAPYDQGKTTLRIEYAGWATANTFGWYNPTGAGVPTFYEIFDGAANAGDFKTVDFAGYSGDTIGFYLGTPLGKWYSEVAKNTDAGGAKPHLRVFDNPQFLSSWVLAWEDKSESTYNWTDAWIKEKHPLTWYHGYGGGSKGEPDYNDMILTFTWVDDKDKPRTPELSTILLLGLSLAAVPVLRRRRRS